MSETPVDNLSSQGQEQQPEKNQNSGNQSDLPSEVQEQLPQGAQNIFRTAFNSAQEDGLSEEAARNVAWNSVKKEYEQGSDGKWQHKPDVSNITNKAVPSGGN